MKYTVCLNGYGSECVVGAIPDEIWKYIQDECDGDADNYLYKLNYDEMPEEFKLADHVSTFYYASCFFQKSGPHPDLEIQVYDEQHHEVLKADCKDVEKNFLELNPAAKAKYYFVWREVQKGIWETEIETDEPFDKSKLKLQVHRIERNYPYEPVEFIDKSIVYNDEEYWLDFEMDEEFDEIYEFTLQRR